MQPTPITLIPLTKEAHAEALQGVYAQTASYWQMSELPSAPPDQAIKDMDEAQETLGRTMLGIVRRLERTNPSAGGELIGLVDFRLDWPDDQMAYLGMIMVAEPYQRQGIGRKAWRLLINWLRKEAKIQRVRLGVEQFNTDALKFFTHIGFELTGEANRIRSGQRFVRLLYMEIDIANETVHHPTR
ncbi:MAG: GNAT family N-acetyltransferase [Chloroflexota bacterium]